MKRNHGFTLIELVVVIGVIGILAGVIYIAINPVKQIGDAQNVKRLTDVQAILTAVINYNLETGAYPSTITTTATEICKTNAQSCAGLVDLSVITANKDSLITMPVDPSISSGNSTGYNIVRSGDNITVSAPHAELGKTISVER